jgi:RNase P/RNase MRP subunit POP5
MNASGRRLERLERAYVADQPTARTIIALDRDEAERELAALVAAGEVTGRDPLIILTGVPRPGGATVL